MDNSALFQLMSDAVFKSVDNVGRDFSEVSNFQHSDLWYKIVSDFVGRTSTKISKSIYFSLKDYYPDSKYIIDNKLWNEHENNTKDYFVISSLDGIESFMRGISEFCISITYFDINGSIDSVMMYTPANKETFWAQKGRGAWSKELVGAAKHLRISNLPDMRRTLIGTVAGVMQEKQQIVVNELVNKGARVISGLSTLINFIRLATGSIDAFIHSGEGLDMRSMLGPMLLAYEAKGKVVNFSGQTYSYSKANKKNEIIICSNYIYKNIDFSALDNVIEE